MLSLHRLTCWISVTFEAQSFAPLQFRIGSCSMTPRFSLFSILSLNSSGHRSTIVANMLHNLIFVLGIAWLAHHNVFLPTQSLCTLYHRFTPAAHMWDRGKTRLSDCLIFIPRRYYMMYYCTCVWLGIFGGLFYQND